MSRGWGPVLVVLGLLVCVAGVLAWTGALSWLGRLPGDLRFGSDRVRVYLPITSMLLVSLTLSVVLSVVLWLMRR
jgi:hypothetical protein